MSDGIDKNESNDGIDRRGFLKCMAWAGTGVLWTVRGGILTSRAFGAETAADARADFSFAQISDSHIGFSKEINKDVAGTLQLAIDRVNAMAPRADLLIHTGDLTHLSKPAEFDAVDQIVKGAKVGRTLYVPGEHDIFTDDGKSYLDRYGKGTSGLGWHSFNHKGVHFIGLVNVANLKPGGLGVLGQEQLAWLKKDVESLGSSTPIVVYAHVPLWAVFPKWGWGTEDSEQALDASQEVRLRHGAQWPHSPGAAEDRREHHVPHCLLDRVPPTSPRYGRFTRPDEKRGGQQTPRNARPGQRELRREQRDAGDHRSLAGLIVIFGSYIGTEQLQASAEWVPWARVLACPCCLGAPASPHGQRVHLPMAPNGC